MDHLIDALERRCIKAGVTLERETEVAQILTQDGEIAGLRCVDGTERAASIVVSDIAAEHLNGDLLRHATPGAAVAASPNPAPSGRHRIRHRHSRLVVQLAVRGHNLDPSRHRVFLPKSHKREHSDLNKGRVPKHPTLWVTANPGPEMAPTGYSAWSIHVNVPSHGTGRQQMLWSDSDVKDQGDWVLTELADRGLNLTDRIEQMWVTTPLDLQARTGLPGGALRPSLPGLDRNLGADVAANTGTVTGLYLVGGSAAPGAGLPFVGQSAENIAEHIGRAE